MKKALLIILSFILAFCLTACDNNIPSDNNIPKELVDDAIEELKSEWKDIYNANQNHIECDGYFEIKNTRIIEIDKTDIEMFKDIEYIIEFVLYTDYFGSAPYYSSIGLSDSVIVYGNGAMEVSGRNLLEVYRAHTFDSDFSDIVKEVYDCRDKYNCVEYLEIGN